MVKKLSLVRLQLRFEFLKFSHILRKHFNLLCNTNKKTKTIVKYINIHMGRIPR